MTIGRICQREVDTAKIGEPAQAAGQRMGTRSVGTLVVLDDQHHPIGILTDRDLAVRVVGRGLDPNTTRVGDVMTCDVQTIHEGMEVEEALSTMRAKAVRRLPVVGSNGRLLGVVSLDDILSHLAREFADLKRLLQKEDPRQLSQT